MGGFKRAVVVEVSVNWGPQTKTMARFHLLGANCSYIKIDSTSVQKIAGIVIFLCNGYKLYESNDRLDTLAKKMGIWPLCVSFKTYI